MNNNYLPLLKNNALFDKMSESEITQILGCLKPLTKTYQPEEFIYIPNTPYDYLYILLSGEISIFKEDISGGRHLLEILEPNATMGEITTFGKHQGCDCAAIATKPSTVLMLPSQAFPAFCHKACLSHQKLVQNTFYLLSDKAHFYKKKINLLTTHSIRLKLVKYFLELYEVQNSSTIILPFNRKELAEYLNTTRPSLSRELSHMQQDGLILFNKNEVKLVSADALYTLLYEL
ncbi:Crp/Fnr family transcriptional regulator [Cellulosilyticum sp. I15G10I2]|uniref:Crp/Fnr family transcriptional regulator n=1 Tax=Cellulosilyticum sp. I15G10I2 TaxID=1892843 RepID=UPI00085C6B60|nr:Crp/Fnr family transcriptional regulator [Cellulosilyticum sp. I15G10I2]